MKNRKFYYQIFIFTLTLIIGSYCFSAKKKKPEVKLTPAGQKALAEYAGMLKNLKNEIISKIPKVDSEKMEKFKTALKAESEESKKKKPNRHKVPKLAKATQEAAKPILNDLDNFLSSDSLDEKLVKAAVLADGTPRALAEFAQQGAKEKKLIDELLADPNLMKEMLVAGGAKAGRYGKAMQIYRSIQENNPKAKQGVFQRLALATALELAAPELCGYQKIDPLKRYKFYEKSYLDKELHPDFDKHSTWLYRQVINDPYSEEDMAWMREMLWNYRPDHINVPSEKYNSRYVGLAYSEFGHKPPEVDESLPETYLQQVIDKGGRCGPKAFFNRCLGRSFGIPVWGCRLRSHTAMTYWTPKGWETILGVSFKNGFWILDRAEPMKAQLFLMLTIIRDNPDEYIKACRAQWVGSLLGEKKIDGMKPAQGGIWNELAYNKIVEYYDENKPQEKPRPKKGKPKPVKIKGYPERLVKPVVKPEFKKVVVDKSGKITFPAVSCVSPKTNTAKVVFMTSRDGGMNLHYKRWEVPEELVYEITAPKAGKYNLTARVVTVNKDQFFTLTVNDAKEPVNVKMPYTVGKWGKSEPVEITLKEGKNKLSFIRTYPKEIDFKKDAWKFAGPSFGGVTIKDFTLTPVQ